MFLAVLLLQHRKNVSETNASNNKLLGHNLFNDLVNFRVGGFQMG
jgi:hypothetical protein